MYILASEMYILATKMYILPTKMYYILAPEMYILESFSNLGYISCQQKKHKSTVLSQWNIKCLNIVY